MGEKREWLSRDTVSQPLARGPRVCVHRQKGVFLLGCLGEAWLAVLFSPLPLPGLPSGTSRPCLQPTAGRHLHTEETFPFLPCGDLCVAPSRQPSRLRGWVVPHMDADPLALSNITAKEVYAILVWNTRHKHRWVKKYFAIRVEWHTVWKNLDQLWHNRVLIDTPWLIGHNVLPTANQLLWFGMSVSPWCHCGHREPIEHLFVECSFFLLIDWLHTLMLHFRSSQPRPMLQEVHFLYWRVDNIPTGFSVLMALVRHQVWTSRNFFRFEHLQLEPRYALEHVKSSFRFLEHLQQCHALVPT